MFNALYHPQNNPTERVNRVVKTMLSAYVKNNQRHWDKYLPSVTCALRTLRHDVTGFTPFFINFGREHVLSGKEYSTEAIQPDGKIVYNRDNVSDIRPAGFKNI